MEPLDQYNPHELVTLFNPTARSYTRSYQGTSYTIPARTSLQVERHVADYLSKHFVDQLLKDKPVILRTDRDKLYQKIRLYE